MPDDARLQDTGLQRARAAKAVRDHRRGRYVQEINGCEDVARGPIRGIVRARIAVAHAGNIKRRNPVVPGENGCDRIPPVRVSDKPV